MNNIISYLIILAICVFGLFIMQFLTNVMNVWKAKVEVDRERLQLDRDIYCKTLNIKEAEDEIEKIIIDVTEQYCILHINNRENKYVSEKEQKEMIKYIRSFINGYMTDVFMRKLKLFCSYEKEEDINRYIDYKISIVVMTRAVRYNADYAALIKDGTKKDVFDASVMNAGMTPNF